MLLSGFAGVVVFDRMGVLFIIFFYFDFSVVILRKWVKFEVVVMLLEFNDILFF